MSDLLIGYGFPESFLDGGILEWEGRPWRLRNGRLHQVGSGEEPRLATTASSQENGIYQAELWRPDQDDLWEATRVDWSLISANIQPPLACRLVGFEPVQPGGLSIIWQKAGLARLG